MTPDEYCAARLKESGSSFTAGFLFLDAPRRQALNALYAFCREVDDAVDECREPRIAAVKLDWWRAEIGRLGDAGLRPTHPVTLALAKARERFDLPLEALYEVIDGMRMDIEAQRYADFNQLRLYCHRVAGVVGQLAAEIFGYGERQTLKYAHTLGIAFQLTNIIRDVGEDARRGRIYLPQDELARFRVPESDILAGRHTPAFAALMAFQAQRARALFAQAFQRLPAADRRAQRPGLVMAAIYQTLLDEIEKDGFLVLDRRTFLPPARKAWLALKTWLIG